ncbi:MAG: hypothetical protein OQL06_15550 [Gammaproteobacteria bacterium]|nr:hypothetical protein [Gammaproteobacteria bacterium]
MMTNVEPKNILCKDRETNLMVITIDNNCYYIPQKDIFSFESVQDLDVEEKLTNSVGRISIVKEKIPVYCFSGDLELLDRPTDNIKICVLLNKINIALLCDDIRVANVINIKIVEMAECMKSNNSPVDSFCLLEGDNSIASLGILIRSLSIKNYINNYKKYNNS